MAASDATAFPIYGQAYRIPCVFRDTTGALLSTWSSAAATAYSDNGAGVSVTVAESPAGSGVGYVDLPASVMKCSLCLVVATIANTGATAFAFGVYPLDVRSFAGRWDAGALRFEKLFLDLYSGLGLNGISVSGVETQTFNADGSEHFAAEISQGQLTGLRGASV